ncbi:MAG: DUF896 domain-containing protein [Clostridia bacterium]|nr:DUF896 domain-containing protein [Lachnospiraceae bacterium]NCC00662.1 DUF896 domain-containing protein [Clostridia bacterium]NCD02674.1 DUF896 domain-containing protein [Clostridia bacterium]
MKDEQIARINELYKKSKTPEGLTPEEKDEQMKLRGEYIASVRQNLRGQLDSIKIKNNDGSIVDLKKKHQDKYGH